MGLRPRRADDARLRALFLIALVAALTLNLTNWNLLARPALAAFAFLVLQRSWNEFLWALIVTTTTEK